MTMQRNMQRNEESGAVVTRPALLADNADNNGVTENAVTDRADRVTATETSAQTGTPVSDKSQPSVQSHAPQLDDNLQALIKARNETVSSYANDTLEIPAALVRLKWKNRREIYPLVVQEEVYGAVLVQIMRRYPQLGGQITEILEKRYQQIKQQEAATLMMARKLAEGNYQLPELRY